MHNFDIIDELGKGGFGKVYLVKYKKNEKLYALKQITVEMNNLVDLKFKLKEIKNLASIESKYIISYKGSYFDKNVSSLLILMEYGENGSLAEKINKNRNLQKYFNEEEIWSILIQILIALSHLKNCKIIHRDLKPANIVFDKNNQLKITDLGLADIIKENKNFICGGTKHYISLEALSNITDFKSDLWSLGCILYELMTLNLPIFFFKNFDTTFIKNKIREIYQKNIYSDYLILILDLLLTVDYKNRPDVEYFLRIPIINEQINSDRNVLNKYKNNNLDSIQIPSNINNLNNNLPKKEIKFFSMQKYINSKEEEDEEENHEIIKKILLKKIKEKFIEDQKKILDSIKRENEEKKRKILYEYLSKIKNTENFNFYKQRLEEQFHNKNFIEFENFIKEVEAYRKNEERERKRQMAILKREEEFNRTRNLLLMKTFTEEEIKKQKNIENLIQNTENNIINITIYNGNKKINVLKSTIKKKKFFLKRINVDDDE